MRKRRTETAVLVLVCGGLAGLLIWSKLRLVSDLPRSAYAVPREYPLPDAAPDTGPDSSLETTPESAPGADAGHGSSGGASAEVVGGAPRAAAPPRSEN